MGHSSYISGCICELTLLASMLVVALRKPYADNSHNYRSIVTSCLGILVLGMDITLAFLGGTDSVVVMYLPYAMIGVNFLSVAMALVFIVKKIAVTASRYFERMSQENSLEEKKLDDDMFDNKELMAQIEEGIKNKNTKNFAQRLLHNKMIQRQKKKKGIVKVDISTLIYDTPDEAQETGLTPQRIKMVDGMLKRGEI